MNIDYKQRFQTVRNLYLNLPEMYFRIDLQERYEKLESLHQFTLILSGKLIIYIYKIVFYTANFHIIYTKNNFTLKIIFKGKI